MSKLHELLAVDSDIKNQAATCLNDLKNTFEKKTSHFSEKIVTFRPSAENAEPKVESQLGLQTTVAKELDWIGEKISKAIDSGHQIDVANLVAKADVVLEDGTVLLKDVPATSLLQLEKRLVEVQTLIAKIPTLDPAQGFTPDFERGKGIFRARDVEKPRTEKQFSFVVMYPATDKHPAQVKELNLDKPVGSVLTQEWSSLITTSAKGDMLDRVEELTRAVRKARARANEMEVDVRQNRIGKTVFDFIKG